MEKYRQKLQDPKTTFSKLSILLLTLILHGELRIHTYVYDVTLSFLLQSLLIIYVLLLLVVAYVNFESLPGFSTSDLLNKYLKSK